MEPAITSDPEIMHGIPVFTATRVPVKTFFDYPENGDSLNDFLEGFPSARRETIIQVLQEAMELRSLKWDEGKRAMTA